MLSCDDGGARWRGLRSVWGFVVRKKKPLLPRGLEGRVWLEKLQEELTFAAASGPADRWSAEEQAELQEQAALQEQSAWPELQSRRCWWPEPSCCWRSGQPIRS